MGPSNHLQTGSDTPPGFFFWARLPWLLVLTYTPAAVCGYALALGWGRPDVAVAFILALVVSGVVVPVAWLHHTQASSEGRWGCFAGAMLVLVLGYAFPYLDPDPAVWSAGLYLLMASFVMLGQRRVSILLVLANAAVAAGLALGFSTAWWGPVSAGAALILGILMSFATRLQRR